MINCHLIPSLGHVFVQKLTPQHVQAFYAQKLKEGLKPRSISVIHGILHTALENAVKWSLVSRNVASLVSVPRAEVHEVHPLTSDEAHKLIEAARGHWFEPILILAVTTGMRRGELLGLRWDDVDLKRGMLHVRRTMNKYSGHDVYAGYGVVENDPKTRTSRRRILLPDVAINALKDQHVLQDAARLKAGDKWQGKNLVFADQCGDFLNPQRVVRHFQSLLGKSGLPHMRFHDLRHSAATILLTMGVHPKVVQELLGHSTIAMTMDTYSHLLPSVQRDAVDKMNEAFRFDGQSSESGEGN
jgi:integrase